MAGHSQFKNIMHRKAAQDKKRSKVFTKLLRDLVTAARQGGGDVAANPNLRAAVDKARAANMTKDVIERAIKRGTGELQGADYVERTYEGYGPGGVAVLVRTLTDNPTRTITNVRTAFAKNGGNVGTDGSVAWMFKQVGVLVYPVGKGAHEDVLEQAILAGADDVQSDEDGHRIYTLPDDFAAVRDALAQSLGDAEEADLTYVPMQRQALTDEEQLVQLEKMIDALNNDDDVQDVIINLQDDDAA
ncbi:MAG: YebC/PmpR family DNA-binding transcriptional regulator [Pseudomonadaceae bacterium]|nr:YebC/PmpR family DNA-binding transcriptional regulator [Pseudomonadaceae bacterium]